MIVPDLNLLLYAEIDAFPQHPVARSWWESALSSTVEVGIAAPVLFGFVRVATQPRIFDPPLALGDAIDRVNRWLGRPRVRFLVPGPRHLEIAFDLFRALGIAGDLTTDVQLAALALEYQAEVHSNDADFGRFPGLRWRNPLVT